MFERGFSSFFKPFKILKISKEIELLISLQKFDKIEQLLDERQILIEQVSNEDFQNQEIKELLEEINSLDKKNQEQLISNKDVVYDKLKNLSKNMQVLSHYKIKNTHRIDIVDNTIEYVFND